MSRLLGLGARFPEFSLQACVSAEPGSEFRIVDAHELEGTWTAVFFWPLDFTFVCPTELVEFNRALREFRALSARVFGVSGAVEWTFAPQADGTTFVNVTEAGFSGDADELVKQVTASTHGFTLMLAGLKAFLEHNVRLNLTADRYPKGIEEPPYL